MLSPRVSSHSELACELVTMFVDPCRNKPYNMNTIGTKKIATLSRASRQLFKRYMATPSPCRRYPGTQEKSPTDSSVKTAAPSRHRAQAHPQTPRLHRAPHTPCSRPNAAPASQPPAQPSLTRPPPESAGSASATPPSAPPAAAFPCRSSPPNPQSARPPTG